MNQSKLERLVELAKKAKEAGGEAIKTSNGWKLIVSDVVWEFIKVAPKLVAELAETLEKRNARIRDLETQLNRETALRLALEEEVRNLKQNKTTTIYTEDYGYGQDSTFNQRWVYSPSYTSSSSSDGYWIK